MTVTEIEKELRQNDLLRELMKATLALKPEIMDKFVPVVCEWVASGGCGGDLEYRLRAAGLTLAE